MSYYISWKRQKASDVFKGFREETSFWFNFAHISHFFLVLFFVDFKQVMFAGIKANKSYSIKVLIDNKHTRVIKAIKTATTTW